MAALRKDTCKGNLIKYPPVGFMMRAFAFPHLKRSNVHDVTWAEIEDQVYSIPQNSFLSFKIFQNPNFISDLQDSY